MTDHKELADPVAARLLSKVLWGIATTRTHCDLPEAGWNSASIWVCPRPSVDFRNEVSPLQHGLVVMPFAVVTCGQFHLFVRNLSIRNLAQENGQCS